MGVVVGVVGAEDDGGVDVGVAEVNGVVASDQSVLGEELGEEILGATVVGVDEVGAVVAAVVGAAVVGAADVAAGGDDDMMARRRNKPDWK